MSSHSTICALATAQGGAIGIIRVSGPEAISIVNAIFSQDISNGKGYTLHFGRIIDHGEVIDEVLVTLFRAPHSYTGEDSVEISCHGSRYILSRVMQLLLDEGCQMAGPGEFTQRAFLNGKMDLSQAEAVADLIASTNAASHRVAMTQMRGGMSHRLADLREQLLHITSLLELELDFSEEDVEFADRTQLLSLATRIENEISKLSSSFASGNAIRNGIPVAILGAPNVGKSTLLNTLVGDDKAIVSDIQGTTRDVIEDTFQLQGVTFRFLDTAGIRTTTDTIERMGIERSLSAASRAHILILMSEPGVPNPDIEIRPDQTVIRICNKTPQFQAINGTGLSWLHEQLLAAVPPIPEDSLLITNIRHKQVLDEALLSIRRAIDAMRQQLPGDLIAEDLNACISTLGEITGGQITTDEVLGNIFKNFCIGK